MKFIVTGYPRSGTSMMMACLEAGGMSVVKSKERDHLIDRTGDAQYRMNPSLYEPGDMTGTKFPMDQEEDAVKIVVPFVRRMAAGKYRVIFMRRDPEEIRQSGEAAYGAKATVEHIEEEVEEAYKVLVERHDVRTLIEVWYRPFLNDPLGILRQLSLPIDDLAAAGVVDQSQCRFKREELVEGL